MREVTVAWSEGRFAQDVEVGGHRFRADEEKDNGGDDSGPAPHELLLAALGSCTAMTLKVYAERKGWPLTDVHVRVTGNSADGKLTIVRRLELAGALDADQRQRLLEIAEKCPVHKSLKGTIEIQTSEGGA